MDRARDWFRIACFVTLCGLAGCDGETLGDGDASVCADDCNDMVACTVDACTDGVCTHTYDEAMCCTSDQCEIDGACYDNGAENPDNPCEVCRVPESATAWSIDGDTTCDDGDPCTTDDACVGGSCRGEAYSCSDGNHCTDDVCDGEGGCTNPNNTAACSDGDACTTGDTCADGACVAGTAASCDDENECTADSCDSATGCAHEPLDGVSCTDPSSCATSSVCQAGVCVPEGGTPCDDDNLCTIDACADASCQHEDISSLCVDSNPCTDDACTPSQGCTFGFNTNACDDSNLCTMTDMCAGGVCTGTPVPVDDLNVCTDDMCLPATGVMHVPNTLPCDDGNACLTNDLCAGGSCQPGTTPVDCDDDNVCTTDDCNPLSGCTHVDITPSCDDGNACTADSCDPETGCAHSVLGTVACRPQIVVTSPRRAETLLGSAGASVTVTGTVQSGAGAITSFTINGTTVSVNPATGAFSHVMTQRVGSNVLILEATDALGSTDRVVQSFHWSTAYTQPTGSPGVGAVAPGLGIWLDQDSIDDGHAPPPTDLAAIFRGVLQTFDLNSLLPNPVATDLDGGAAGTYDVFLSNLTWGTTQVTLDAIDGGFHIVATIPNVTADLLADKTCTYSIFNPLACVGPGTITGDITIDYIVMQADIMLSVSPAHTLVATVTNPSVAIAEPDVNIDGFLAFIIEPIIQGQISGFVPTLQAQFTSQLSTVIGPLIEDGLSALAFNQSFDLPRLDGSTPGITVDLASDFSFTTFQDATPGPQGGAIGLRAWASAATRGTPSGYPFGANRGVPMRINCGSPPQVMTVPRVAPLEIVFPDDTVNQILRGAWWGGLLEFPVDPSLLSGVDLGSYGVSNLSLVVSGWLPPIASDCNGTGDLRLYIGDLRINASMNLFGQPLDAVVWVSFEAPIRLGANAMTGEIEIVVSSVENVEVEVNVVQEALLGAEPALQTLLETELVPALGSLLGGGTPLASFPLPEMDLSSALGQPPGTSVVRIMPLTGTLPGPERANGNTMVYGRLQ